MYIDLKQIILDQVEAHPTDADDIYHEVGEQLFELLMDYLLADIGKLERSLVEIAVKDKLFKKIHKIEQKINR